MTQFKEDYLLIFGGGKNVGTLDSGLKIKFAKAYENQKRAPSNEEFKSDADDVVELEVKEYEIPTITPGVIFDWHNSDNSRENFLIFSDLEDKLWTGAFTMIGDEEQNTIGVTFSPNDV